MGEEEEAVRENLLVNVEAENGIRTVVLQKDGNGGNPADSAITPVLLFSILVASCGSFVSGCGVGYTSPVESAMMSDLDLSTAQFSLFGSLCTAGGLVGSIISGKMTDYLGRRWTMGITAVSCLIGWIVIAASQAAWSLYIGRLFVGLGLGIISYVIPIYAAEITPKNLRGGAVLTYMLVICCGISVMFFVGVIVNWRVLALIGTIPCIIQIVGLPFVPESPRWLVKVGREKEYEASLRRLRGNNVDISSEVAEIKEYTEAIENMQESNFLALFQQKYAYALGLGLGLMALAQFGGPMGIVYYASEIYEAAGFSTTVGTLTIAVIQVPVTIVGVFLMDKVGRRPLLVFSASGMCIGCALGAFSFLLKDLGWLTKIGPSFAYIGITLYSAAYPMGVGGVPFIIMSEIFPINVKGTAGSLATSVNWLASWVVSYAFSFMLDWSTAGSFLILACMNAILILFVVKLVPETKGRMLEEIQESLTHAVHRDGL